MLISYTSVSALFPDQQVRLRAMYSGLTEQTAKNHIMFEGVALNAHEVLAFVRQGQASNRQTLLG